MTSKRRLRRESCQGKARHKTPEAAWLQAYNSRDVRDRHRLQPYRCGFCGCWHIGHAPTRVLRKMAAA
ncbi:MAG: hypothetical protein KGL39_12810 [Patescibacteria group bacterium]|nr:hypothetical protein [Patescibacteria group bacterium]